MIKGKQVSSQCSLAHVVWLVDHTSLTFGQIASLANMHVLEVQSVADGDRGKGIRGVNPVASGLVVREEIEKGQKESTYVLQVIPKFIPSPKKHRRYIPLTKRQQKPDAVAWLLKNIPNISDSQIIRLVGTTRTTIGAIREKTYWKMDNIQPIDPVLHGFCSQKDLDDVAEEASVLTKIASKTH